MTPLLLRAWSRYLRLTMQWPSIGTLVPFIPLLVAWWVVTELRVFPPAFLPGPAEVVHSFGSLVYTGVLPDYLVAGSGELDGSGSGGDVGIGYIAYC